MARFLLPCACGRQLPVTAAQAGDQLQCECGQRLEVPTLRHLAAFERLEEAAPQRVKSWGVRQGLVFLGASIIAIAAVCLLVLQLQKPEQIHEQLIQTNIEGMTPAEMWRAWPILERGIRRSLFPGEVSVLARNLLDIRTWEQWRLMALAVGSIGVLLVAIGLFIVRPPRRRTSGA
jgi:Domain of unknown function (DUF1922)